MVDAQLKVFCYGKSIKAYEQITIIVCQPYALHKFGKKIGLLEQEAESWKIIRSVMYRNSL